jgi:FKBP-type peptidyl-prolyl cis-trans isomerase
MKKEFEELKKSGEMDKQIKAMETYLAGKKISAQKTNEGTFVVVNQKGSGEPAVDGKFISVKYTGKILETDSVFESNVYTFQMGTGNVIRGWDDGLKLFSKGGKGILYVPGFLAYGKNAGPGGKPYQALIFDVEVLNVSNTQEQPATTAVPPPPDSTKRKRKG